MFYFVNPVAPPQSITGIERAEYNRYRIFKAHQQPTKLVSTQFNQFLVENCATFSLDPDDVINLYDYFCRIDYHKPVAEEAVEPFRYDERRQDGNFTRYFLAGYLIRKVRRFDNGQLISVYDYNRNRQSLSVTFYRPGNYPAQGQFFTAHNGRLLRTRVVYYDQAGRERLEFDYPNGQESPSLITLTDDENESRHSFETVDQLAGYFFDELVRADSGAVFIAEHVSDLIPALANMREAVTKYAFIHNLVKHQDNVVTGYYRPLAEEVERWQGLLTSTREQAVDLHRRWPQLPVYHVNVSVLDKHELTRPVPQWESRDAHAILMLVRVDPAKNIAGAVQVLAKVRETDPLATLEIWGSNDISSFSQYQRRLHDFIAELGLTAAVHFHGYTPVPTKALDTARVLLMTSRNEGTGLVINEALAAGVPVVSYDFQYGPRAFIHSGQNGFIVPVGDSTAAAQAVLRLLTNSAMWNAFSAQARIGARGFDADHNWQHWRPVLQKIRRQANDLSHQRHG